MVYLEYHLETKQVVGIFDSIPANQAGYDYVKTDAFKVGDEFEVTINVQSVDTDKNLISYSAIKNNPQAKKLLKENEQLKTKTSQLEQENAQLKTDIGNVLLENANDKAKIDSLEAQQGSFLMEIATLKMGGNA
jgi:hypothetical protein